MSSNVRIDGSLMRWIDAAIEDIRDEFGSKKYLSRRAVIDDAVKRLMKELAVKPKEAQ